MTYSVEVLEGHLECPYIVLFSEPNKNRFLKTGLANSIWKTTDMNLNARFPRKSIGLLKFIIHSVMPVAIRPWLNDQTLRDKHLNLSCVKANPHLTVVRSVARISNANFHDD